MLSVARLTPDTKKHTCLAARLTSVIVSGAACFARKNFFRLLCQRTLSSRVHWTPGVDSLYVFSRRALATRIRPDTRDTHLDSSARTQVKLSVSCQWRSSIVSCQTCVNDVDTHSHDGCDIAARLFSNIMRQNLDCTSREDERRYVARDKTIVPR